MIPGNALKIPQEKIDQGKRIIKYAQIEHWSNDRIDAEVAIMQADCLGLKKCIKPPEKPQAYIDYHNESKELKKAYKKEFNANPIIQEYVNKIDWVKTMNTAKLYWLEIYLKIYESKKMEDEVFKCKQLIKEHYEVGGAKMSMNKIQQNYFD